MGAGKTRFWRLLDVSVLKAAKMIQKTCERRTGGSGRNNGAIKQLYYSSNSGSSNDNSSGNRMFAMSREMVVSVLDFPHIGSRESVQGQIGAAWLTLH